MSAVIERPDRHAIARMVGLGRGVLYGMAAATIISTAGAVAMGLLLYREVKTDGDRIERYAIYLDGASNVTGVAKVGGDFIVTERMLLDFAPRWIRNLRARPKDNFTIKWQRNQAGLATDRKLVPALNKLLNEADERYGTASVDVLPSMSANVVKMDSPNQAIVIVRWVERVNRGVAEEKPWTARLTIVSRAPPTTLEFNQNPLGLYVVDVTMAQEQQS
jgi:type IV secretory pathway TrbF-like protein